MGLGLLFARRETAPCEACSLRERHICVFEGGGNQSADLGGKRKRYLDRLSEKHGLGELPTKNFAVLLEEPDMKRREAPTDIVWDGKPVHSRLHSS